MYGWKLVGEMEILWNAIVIVLKHKFTKAHIFTSKQTLKVISNEPEKYFKWLGFFPACFFLEGDCTLDVTSSNFKKDFFKACYEKLYSISFGGGCGLFPRWQPDDEKTIIQCQRNLSILQKAIFVKILRKQQLSCQKQTVILNYMFVETSQSKQNNRFYWIYY